MHPEGGAGWGWRGLQKTSDDCHEGRIISQGRSLPLQQIFSQCELNSIFNDSISSFLRILNVLLERTRMQISELVGLLACSWRFPPLMLPSERGASDPLSRPGTQVLQVHLLLRWCNRSICWTSQKLFFFPSCKCYILRVFKAEKWTWCVETVK